MVYVEMLSRCLVQPRAMVNTLIRKESTMQFYSDPGREQDPHALPDCEVYHTSSIVPEGAMLGFADRGEAHEPGWYWQSQFPGCLPDSDPVGPFETEELAIADCREGVA